MTKHTPEPWEVEADGDGFAITGQGGMPFVGRIDSGDFGERQNMANAARIVACVNACVGLPRPETSIGVMRAEIARLRKIEQAAREALDAADHPDTDDFATLRRNVQESLRAALEG